mgnify:CR=1 FL=1
MILFIFYFIPASLFILSLKGSEFVLSLREARSTEERRVIASFSDFGPRLGADSTVL